MSSPTLSEAIAEFGTEAYLLTIGKDGPHTTPVLVELNGELIG